jgi:hypothetical protein
MRIPLHPPRQPIGPRPNAHRPYPPSLLVTRDGRIVTREEAEREEEERRNREGRLAESEINRRKRALIVRAHNKETDGDDCCVCLVEYNEQVAANNECVHVFHVECMEKWLEQKNTCPLCNTIVAP